ncbi:hypothetical protein GON03_07985 [Nocardioides sp. MAH-18]|uniref:Histidine kinase domain-containing protein n=1 Tax=Nocardioides agri TaxID=2682843 RepID=A0A6L6XPC2_9ACTN|nr:HAMP domain-containing sensor histidine kinase [Nocardioides sp. CGMCC 1.13656]MBA2954258.1 HAMP domain-containing histidine kinase [Nocardioides sp. CGMCC 1.13656]MVQ49119.1 hypothetical protein [Nocardioides sp. MAH-18]
MGERETVRAVVIGCGAALVPLAALTIGGPATSERAADICVLASAVAVLCAAVLFYIDWHVDDDPSMAWLVTAAAAYSLQQVNWFTLLTDGPDTADSSVWVYLFQIGVIFGLGSVLVRGDRLPVRWDPLALGLLLGLGVIVARIGVLAIPSPAPSTAGYVAVLIGLGVVSLSNVARLLLSSVLTRELRHRLALASALLAVGQVSAATGSPYALLTVSAMANIVGSTLLVRTAVTDARRAVVAEASALRTLRGRLETADHDLHTGKARLHEFRATLAGIKTATELLQRTEIAPSYREHLHQMAVAELQRLDRLVSDASTGPVALIELDATLRPIVVRHEAAGLAVSWQPSGHVVMARPDDVAEIVDVLLSNAHRHAAGHPVRVGVRAAGTAVELTVSDDGPGVDPAVRPWLFSWGAHGPQSPGQGIGLAAARMLAEQLDGWLDIAPDAGRGAQFVLSLPAPVVAVAEPQDLGR